MHQRMGLLCKYNQVGNLKAIFGHFQSHLHVYSRPLLKHTVKENLHQQNTN